jgi:PTS system cellobiose-specific IIB component
MKKCAEEQGIDCKIWAVPVHTVQDEIDKADVLLLGPQVSYMLPKMKELGKAHNIPVDKINPTHYGMCNGPEVLKFAMNLVNQS